MQAPSPPAFPQRIEVVVQPPPAADGATWLDTATTLGWPLAALLIALVFRNAIADALKGLGARARSVSLGMIAFDFGDAAVQGLTPESLDDIRDTASHAPVGDSGSALTATLNDRSPAECTVVDLGDGEEWITSRLYVVVTLVARMRGLRVMVFTALGPNGRRFIGSARPDEVRWALAAAYPWLEVAYVQAWNSQVAGVEPAMLDRSQLEISRGGGIDSWRAIQIFQAYKQALQRAGPPLAAEEWVDLAGVCERAEWVTPALLTRVLGPVLNEQAVQHDFDITADELARRVLRFPLDYVPTVDSAGKFLRVVARREYASRTLRQVADQGVS